MSVLFVSKTYLCPRGVVFGLLSKETRSFGRILNSQMCVCVCNFTVAGGKDVSNNDSYS